MTRWFTVLIAVVGVLVCAPVTRASADECGANALPAEIQAALARDFSDWKIQQAADLSKMAHGRWAGDKKPACAGVAVGHFTGTDTTDYALLLAPAHAGEGGYRFVVFKQVATGYAATILEKSSRGDAGNFFIRSVPSRDWIDDVTIKGSHVQAADAIEMIDCGENEYEADLYYWSNGKFTHSPIDN
jgi:hypothetical protein